MSEEKVGAAELRECANEMNSVMGLDPKIKTVAVKAQVLTESIINNAIGADEDGNITPEDGIQETDNFSPNVWSTLAAILDPENDDHAAVLAIAIEKAGAVTEEAKVPKAGKPAKVPKAEKPAKVPKEKKDGVIATIVSIISANPSTIEEIVAELSKKFPEREPEKMATTARIQLSGRLQKEKGLQVEKNDKKQYFIK